MSCNGGRQPRRRPGVPIQPLCAARRRPDGRGGGGRPGLPRARRRGGGSGAGRSLRGGSGARARRHRGDGGTSSEGARRSVQDNLTRAPTSVSPISAGSRSSARSAGSCEAAVQCPVAERRGNQVTRQRQRFSEDGTRSSSQQVRVAGTLRIGRKGGGTFTLVLPSGARVRGKAASEACLTALGRLPGRLALISGRALFSRSGSLLRIEASRVEQAGARDLVLWGASPQQAFGPLAVASLRRRQGPRSGVAAIFGKLADGESDADIIAALEQFS